MPYHAFIYFKGDCAKPLTEQLSSNMSPPICVRADFANITSLCHRQAALVSHVSFPPNAHKKVLNTHDIWNTINVLVLLVHGNFAVQFLQAMPAKKQHHVLLRQSSLEKQQSEGFQQLQRESAPGNRSRPLTLTLLEALFAPGLLLSTLQKNDWYPLDVQHSN